MKNTTEKDSSFVTIVEFNLKRIKKISSIIPGKVLLQVEGATCSGKSSLISGISGVLKRKKIDAMTIEEAARRVLTENTHLLERLVVNPQNSEEWRKSKLELQKKVLLNQVESLNLFADSGASLALMDRGGASTACHTIPLLNGTDGILIEEICREISKLSSQVILLSPLGFLDNDSLRYQRNLEEIEAEHNGIKYFLDKWKLSHLEIDSPNRRTRVEKGVKCVLSLLNSAER